MSGPGGVSNFFGGSSNFSRGEWGCFQFFRGSPPIFRVGGEGCFHFWGGVVEGVGYGG